MHSNEASCETRFQSAFSLSSWDSALPPRVRLRNHEPKMCGTSSPLPATRNWRRPRKLSAIIACSSSFRICGKKKRKTRTSGRSSRSSSNRIHLCEVEIRVQNSRGVRTGIPLNFFKSSRSRSPDTIASAREAIAAPKTWRSSGSRQASFSMSAGSTSVNLLLKTWTISRTTPPGTFARRISADSTSLTIRSLATISWFLRQTSNSPSHRPWVENAATRTLESRTTLKTCARKHRRR